MSGERRLRALLAGMDPRLLDGEYVFCSLSPERYAELKLEPLATFREDEGTSIVLARQAAEAAGFEFDFLARGIALQVHSALNAVGFLAAIASRLAEAGISVNPIAATFHDYLFVPADKADQAMQVLQAMKREAA